MIGEWHVDNGGMYDAAPNTISCWRVYEVGVLDIERRTVAVFFLEDDARAVVRAHNEALKAVAA